MRRYGAFLIESDVHELHEKPVAVPADAARDPETGRRDVGRQAGRASRSTGRWWPASRRRRASSRSTRARSRTGAGRRRRCPATSAATSTATRSTPRKGEMVLLPTFRLPTLIHTRSGNAKYLNEISHRNPLWIHTSDAERLGLATRRPRAGDDRDRLLREPRLGDGVDRARRRRLLAPPGPLAAARGRGQPLVHGARCASRRRRERLAAAPGRGRRAVRERRSRLAAASGGATAASTRTSTFPVHPDPVSGMHCWHQKVVVAPARAGRPLRRRLRGHEPVDGGLPRVARPGRGRARARAACAVRSGSTAPCGRPTTHSRRRRQRRADESGPRL